MVRGGHGLFKVSSGPAMPYPSKPCDGPPPRCIGFTAFSGVARPESRRPAAVFHTPRRTRMETSDTQKNDERTDEWVKHKTKINNSRLKPGAYGAGFPKR
jgi:hypothetical protein